MMMRVVVHGWLYYCLRVCVGLFAVLFCGFDVLIIHCCGILFINRFVGVVLCGVLFYGCFV